MIKERAADWHTELDFWKCPHFRSLLERLVLFWQQQCCSGGKCNRKHTSGGMWNVETIRYRCPELATLQFVCIPHLFVKLQGILLLNFSVTRISEQMLDDNILSHKKPLLKEVSSAYLRSTWSHWWQDLPYSRVQGLAWAICLPFHLKLCLLRPQVITIVLIFSLHRPSTADTGSTISKESI